jgi:hypothetical protein
MLATRLPARAADMVTPMGTFVRLVNDRQMR